MLKEYKYEVALSYAHANMDIAELFGNAFRDIFANSFFMDCYQEHELANADNFEGKLKYLFSISKYAVILYSPEYDNGLFTKVELEEIASKDYQNYFIINIDRNSIENITLEGLTFIKLEVPANSEQLNKKIITIVNTIKKYIIHRTIENRLFEDEFSINIHTLFGNGNIAAWQHEFDWNLLTCEYIRSGDRRLKDTVSWSDLWNYIQQDFLMLKTLVNAHRNIRFRIMLNCHLSIAYKLGQIYGDMYTFSRRNLILESSNSRIRSAYCFETEAIPKTLDNFYERFDGNDIESSDIACIVSIKPTANKNIVQTVRSFLNNIGQKHSKIYLFLLSKTVENTEELESLADNIYRSMQNIRTCEKSVIHLFLDTLAPLAFVLGSHSTFPGEVKLYEYFTDSAEYELSLTKNMA